MRVIVFIVFTFVYVLTAAATLLAFLASAGLISTKLAPGAPIPNLQLLITAVLVETAGGYFALARNLFGLRKPSPESEQAIRELTLTAMKLLRDSQSIAYRYASDLQGLMEKYGRYVAMDIDLTKMKGRQEFILRTTNEIESAITEGEEILRGGNVKKIRKLRDKLATYIPRLENMLTGVTPVLIPGTIGISEFEKLDMRVGQIKSAEAVPGMNKLVKIVVNIGEKEDRQVVAGIGKAYTIPELVDKKVVVLANLQPRTIQGVESNGMIITAAADPKGKAALCTFSMGAKTDVLIWSSLYSSESSSPRLVVPATRPVMFASRAQVLTVLFGGTGNGAAG